MRQPEEFTKRQLYAMLAKAVRIWANGITRGSRPPLVQFERLANCRQCPKLNAPMAVIRDFTQHQLNEIFSAWEVIASASVPLNP
jgi:hypothetical protein